jgi:hypothetical protein
VEATGVLAAYKSRIGTTRNGSEINAVRPKPIPDEQHDHRSDRRRDETRALIEPIPTDRLAEESRQKGDPLGITLLCRAPIQWL